MYRHGLIFHSIPKISIIQHKQQRRLLPVVATTGNATITDRPIGTSSDTIATASSINSSNYQDVKHSKGKFLQCDKYNSVQSLLYFVQQRNSARVRYYTTYSSIESEDDFWKVRYSSLLGFWKYLTDESVRQSFQQYVQKKIIHQPLLVQNQYGRKHMFALLYGLSNPLFIKHEFQPIEFVQHIGPALKVYHDLLFDIMTSETTKVASDNTTSNKNTDTTTPDGINDEDDENDGIMEWYNEAKNKSTTSNIGKLYRIVTDNNFRERYQTFKLQTRGPMSYVPNSCCVEYVSLLNAKIIEVVNDYDVVDSNNDNDTIVLARIKVLYNFKYKVYINPNKDDNHDGDGNNKISDLTEAYKSMHGSNHSDPTPVVAPGSDDKAKTQETNSVDSYDTNATTNDSNIGGSTNTDTNDVNTSKNNKGNNDTDIGTETYTDTKLGVATIEGWFKGSPPNITAIGTKMLSEQEPKQHQLRWKVVSATEAKEFWGATI